MTAAVVAGGMAIAGAASSAMNKPKAQTQTSTQTSTPWEPQAIRLNRNYELADSARDAALALGPPQGDLQAGMHDLTRQGYDQSAAYGQGTGADLANQANAGAGALLSATPGYVANAQSLAANGAGAQNATAANTLTAGALGHPLAQTGATGQAGQTGMGGALTTAQGLVAQAQGDPAQRALATGNDYANSDVVRQQIDNAALDVTRNFNENTSPSLNARASAGGNLNSARAGIAEGLARRDAGEAIGRISADMRGAAFGQGVDASLAGNAQNNALALGANQQAGALGGAMADLGETQRQFDSNTRLGAATTLGQQDLANRGLDAETRLAGNAQVGDAAFRGFDAAQAAGALTDANSGRMINAGQAFTDEANRQINEDEASRMRDYNYRMGILNDHMGILTAGGVQGGTVAATGTTSAPQGQNWLQGALGGAMMGAGASSYFRQPVTVGGNRKS